MNKNDNDKEIYIDNFFLEDEKVIVRIRPYSYHLLLCLFYFGIISCLVGTIVWFFLLPDSMNNLFYPCLATILPMIPICTFAFLLIRIYRIRKQLLYVITNKRIIKFTEKGKDIETKAYNISELIDFWGEPWFQVGIIRWTLLFKNNQILTLEGILDMDKVKHLVLNIKNNEQINDYNFAVRTSPWLYCGVIIFILWVFCCFLFVTNLLIY